MPIVGLFNKEGQKVKDIELNDCIFGAEVNANAMHSVVVALLANKRQGTQSSKTRAEVRGGGIKIWKQKGTGRARHSSNRAPQFTHGGVVFAPKPRSYRITVPKSLRKVAMRSALSSKVVDNDLIVLQSLDFEAPKTKEMVKILSNFEAKKALIVTAESNEVVYKSARNIEGIAVLPVNNLNVYDILKYDKFIVTEDAVKKIEEVFA